jgi:hypothetical protein
MSEMLEREKASSSPAPQRSVTFRLLPPELEAKLTQPGGTPLPPELKIKFTQSGGTGSRSRWPFMRGRLLRSGTHWQETGTADRGTADRWTCGTGNPTAAWLTAAGGSLPAVVASEDLALGGEVLQDGR